MLLLWDGLRKPNYETMAEQIINIEGENVNVAHFDTDPFETVDEYNVWKHATEIFIKKNGHKPISKSDFDKLKTIVNA